MSKIIQFARLLLSFSRDFEILDGNGNIPVDMSQWTRFPERVREWYRHSGNIMWADGHASQAREGEVNWKEEWWIGRNFR